MRAPNYWSNDPAAPGWQARLLAPLGAIYALATRRRVARSGYRSSVPVICVGNLSAGGAGKTPSVIALIHALGVRGNAVHVVSRGYGGSMAGPVRVNEREHSAAQVGDEPLLMSAFGPVWVANDRAAGVQAAEAAGAEVIVLDDGFQNPSIEKDFSLVVVDAGAGFGNGRCIPAGPLREPVPDGLKRANAVLVIGPEEQRAGFVQKWSHTFGDLPLFQGRLAPLYTGMKWQDARVFAFAGIARPEKFFATLRELEADVVATKALDDHQPLTSALFTRLEREAQSFGAQLVTTEKDAVRLPMELRRKVLSVPVRLEIENEGALLDLMYSAGRSAF